MQDRGARQKYWRVLWLGALFGITALSAFLIAESYIKRLTTTFIAPKSTTTSMRFLLDKQSTPVIMDQFGPVAPFSAVPFTLQELYPFISREFTLHFTDTSITGIGIDGVISPELQTELEELNLFVHTDRGLSLISTTATIIDQPKPKFQLLSLFPTINTDVLSFTTKEPQRLVGRLTSDSLTIYGHFPSPSTTTQFPIPESITAQALIPVESNDVLTYINRLIPFQQPNEQLPTSTLFLGNDERGLVYYLFIPFSELSKEQLATIGREMINRSELSTSALTLKDGTRVRELRSNPQKIRSTITSSEDITSIYSIGASGEEVMILGVEHGFSIANRDFFQKISTKPSLSTCLPNAHYYANSMNRLPFGFTHRAENVFTQFGIKEFGIAKRQMRFCF